MRLCFVLLPDSKPLGTGPFERAIKEFPQLGAVKWGAPEKEGAASFKVGGIEVITALMPVPVPDGEADGATERSLSGLGGSWTLPEHRAHLVVVQPGATHGSVDELTTFTRVVAAIVRATNALGVYWGEGGATHHPEFVVNIAHTELPLPLWIGISIAEGDGVTELLSIGMKQLDLPDLLLEAPHPDAKVLEFFYDLLAYVTRRGKKLPQGDTVGRTEKERLKVRYVKSPIDPSAEVWSVRIPAVKPAKKKKPASAKTPKKKTRK
jgi:hypothetical protein